MLVYFRIEQGPHAGRRIDLKPGQTATLGSTDYADFCFEKDQQMADVHLRVSIDQNDVRVEHVAEKHETLVNGKPVSTVVVQSGDQLQLGQTQISVAIEKVMMEPVSASPEQLTTGGAPQAAEPELDLKQLAKNLQFSEESQAIAEQHREVDALLPELKTNGHWQDSIKLQAYVMPANEAVLWVAKVVQEFVGFELRDAQKTAFDAAIDWASEPTEEKRRSCEQLANENESEGVGGMLAMASFYCEGSIAPAECEDEVYAEDFVASIVLAGAVATAIGEHSPDKSEELYLQFLENVDNT